MRGNEEHFKKIKINENFIIISFRYLNILVNLIFKFI